MSERNGRDTDWRVLRDDCLADLVTRRKEADRLRPRTRGQAIYLKAIENSVVTVATGPAGTGKTYIPVGLAAQLLRDGKIDRVVLTRPLVTCSGRRGKGPGFLPGDLQEKVAPFMRPMLDVLHRFFNADEVRKLMADGHVEVIPLDYMRGLSIDRAMIVADEMQNADREQWLMLLTRIGECTTLVASGDATQTDLPHEDGNTLLYAIDRLRGDPDISIVRLSTADVVRSGVVRRIVSLWGDGK